MGMFTGRQLDKSIFSLNTESGGDINRHYEPNVNTIFHSDMPHLYIEEKHVVTLANSTDNYYIGEMPTALAGYMNAGSRVIIPILVFSYNGVEYRRQMTGRHEAVGYSYYQAPPQQLGLVNASRHGATFPDQMLEWGTFIRGTGTVGDEIALHGTGGMMVRCSSGLGDDNIQSASSANYANGCAAIYSKNTALGSNKPEQNYWTPLEGSPYPNTTADEKRSLVDPHWIAPQGALNGGHTHVFVRPDGGRCFGYSAIYAGGLGSRFRESEPYDYNPRWGGYDDTFTNQIRGDFKAFRDIGMYTTESRLTYALVPLRMEFLIVNLSFDRINGYTARNMFTGRDIIISRDQFVIKGLDLRSNEFEFLTSVDTGVPGNNANNFFAANSQTTAMNTYPDGGSLGLPGTDANGNAVVITPSGGTSSGSIPTWKVGTYKIPKNSSVLLDSRTNSLSLDGKVIWGPSVRPLMLFPADKASNVIIGQNNGLLNVGENSSILLNSVDIGLPATGTSTIIMSMEYMSVGLHVTGDRQFEIGAAAALHYNGSALRLYRKDYDVGDAIQHQIMVLEPWQFIPILGRRNISFYSGGGTQVPRSNIVYYIRKNGDTGAIEFWAYSFSKVGWINATKFRINIQRLT